LNLVIHDRDDIEHVTSVTGLCKLIKFFFILCRVKLILITYLFINISNTPIMYMNIHEVKGVRKLK